MTPKLEKIGGVLTSAFGDKVALGIFTAALSKSTPERTYQYIKDNLELLYWASDSQWEKYRKIVRRAKIGSVAKVITAENVIEELRKHRLDLVSVIINHPDGMNWLARQIAEMKKKLGLE